jgi:hypothetical protein
VLVNADKRSEHGTARDVAGAYNSQFVSFKRTGARTSLIVDPPDGRMPPLTAEAQKAAAAERKFHLAPLQATDTCREKSPACNGGRYDPTPSPQFGELPPRYNTVAINRHDGPEDGNLANRCLTGGLPEFGSRTGSYRRIVQTPGGISISYSYRFDTPDRSIVFTGDTGPSEAVAKLAHGADLLISEVTWVEEWKAQQIASGRWQTMNAAQQAGSLRHMNEEHLTPEEVGRIASRANVKTVVLSHIPATTNPNDDYMRFGEKVRQHFSGQVFIADDLKEY